MGRFILPTFTKKKIKVMHQFILDNIEFILAIIIIAQGIILYGQSTIFKWCKGCFTSILEALSKSSKFNAEMIKSVEDLYSKINLDK